MSWIEISCRIDGTSPLLLHKFPPVPPPAGHEKKPPQEQAEYLVWRGKKQGLVFPAFNLSRSFAAGGKHVKSKGRATCYGLFPGAVEVSGVGPDGPEFITLGATEFSVDTRPVVNCVTKGRVNRHRAKLDTWSMEVSIRIEDGYIGEQQVKDAVRHAGIMVGVGDYSPRCSGMFGKFTIGKWERTK